MLTEKEAKTKWCPFARTVPALGREPPTLSIIEGAAPHNRIAVTNGTVHAVVYDKSHRCLGSACMAWRIAQNGPNAKLDEAKAHKEFGSTINAVKALREFDPRLGLKEAKDAVDSGNWPKPHSSEGFCGLAGKP